MLFFQILCFRMGAYENELGAFNYSKVPMYVKLLMTLWTLGIIQRDRRSFWDVSG